MSEKTFEGRTAIVTGGARGIGRAICVMLAENGAKVAINFVRNEGAAKQTQEIVEKAGADSIIVQADVSQREDVERMVESAREQLGPIDFLVNNAGIAEHVMHDGITHESWKRMFEVNVDGPFLTTWAVKDEMIELRYGRIVNISSLAGILIKQDMIHYATTKAALISFTRHCAQAFAPHNIRVNCVAPGATNTDIARNADPKLIEQIISLTPMGRMAEPEEMVGAVKFLLSDESSYITGQTITACGGRG